MYRPMALVMCSTCIMLRTPRVLGHGCVPLRDPQALVEINIYLYSGVLRVVVVIKQQKISSSAKIILLKRKLASYYNEK